MRYCSASSDAHVPYVERYETMQLKRVRRSGSPTTTASSATSLTKRPIPLAVAFITILYVLSNEHSVASLVQSATTIHTDAGSPLFSSSKTSSPAISLNAVIPTSPHKPRYFKRANYDDQHQVQHEKSDALLVHVIHDDAPPLRRFGHALRQVRFLLNHQRFQAHRVHQLFYLDSLMNSTTERSIVSLLANESSPSLSFRVVSFSKRSSTAASAFLKRVGADVAKNTNHVSAKYTIIAPLDCFFSDESIDVVTSHLNGNTTASDNRTLYEIPFQYSVKKRHDVFINGSYHAYTPTFTSQERQLEQQYQFEQGLIPYLFDPPAPILFTSSSSLSKPSSFTTVMKQVSFCIHTPSIYPSYTHHSSASSSMLTQSLLRSSLTFYSSFTTARQSSHSPFKLNLLNDGNLRVFLYYVRTTTPATHNAIHASAHQFVSRAHAVLASIRRHPHDIDTAHLPPVISMLSMAWALTSELKYLQLASNLILRHMYSNDHDMVSVSGMGLELCQVLDSVKLMLRTSYVMNEGLNMKRIIRMKSFKCDNLNKDDNKNNLMACICIYSATNDHLKLYRFIHDNLPSITSTSATSNLYEYVLLASMLNDIGYPQLWTYNNYQVLSRIQSALKAATADHVPEEAVWLLRMGRQAVGEAAHNQDIYVKEWEDIEDAYALQIDSLQGVFNLSISAGLTSTNGVTLPVAWNFASAIIPAVDLGTPEKTDEQKENVLDLLDGKSNTEPENEANDFDNVDVDSDDVEGLYTNSLDDWSLREEE